MPLPTIHIGGDFFLNEDGAEFHYVGESNFAQWKRFNQENGPEALVRPILMERRSIADRAGYTGPIVDRVFRYSDPGNVFGALPGSTDYTKVNAFLDLCADYHIYVDWTCGDSQAVLPTVEAQQADLDKFTSQIQRFCFVETSNETFKNGELPEHGVKPQSSPHYLRDSGWYTFINDTTKWEPRYNLDFISFHGDRTNDPPRWPKWVCDLDDSISVLRTQVRLPVVLKEPNKFGVYYTDPACARQLGLRAAMGGVTFHSQLGLESNGYDDAHRVAAGEFFAGAKGALG